ncbi:hypothetical protein DCCM_2749 [Desulfocucumis palustris]|uniref:Uncharacterized protein n=1 Tax=Desulfocucumis palustris TaxID=1898651 RepID=A0A2L2XD39_9FIRM|nr:hypothetical protein DCCM_2749 [Desulfocucumis palustris]
MFIYLPSFPKTAVNNLTSQAGGYTHDIEEAKEPPPYFPGGGGNIPAQ